MSHDAARAPENALGPYVILEEIGSGGMGRVFRARHAASDREVAIKTVKKLTAAHALALRLEIAALRVVRHDDIVRLIEDATEDGFPWYAMELLDGETLANFNRRTHGALGLEKRDGLTQSDTIVAPSSATVPVARGASPVADPVQQLERTLMLYRAICAPLGHIHGHGMVHRDLKPLNVFIRRDGRPVLMDFGLSGYASGGLGREVLDEGERALGSIPYLAPERIAGIEVDARADLYALGCMLFETLTGQPPFQGDAAAVLNQHSSADPPRPSSLVLGLPPEIDELVLGLLQKAPRARVGRVADVADVLDRVLGTPSKQTDVAGTQLYRPALTGREALLDELDRALKNADRGEGGFIVLSGESGVGKTRLASEFVSRATRAGFRVVTGECIGLSADVRGSGFSGGPFHPLKRLLQRIGDSCFEGGGDSQQRILGNRTRYLAAYEPSLARFVTSASDGHDALSGAAALERVISAFGDTLRDFARDTPLLLVIDDLQWADDLSLLLLESLNREFFVNTPLLVIGTLRANEASPRLQALVRLQAIKLVPVLRLEERHVESMVSDMLAMDPVPAQLVRFVSRESEGNPFFVAEYLRFLVAGAHLNRVGSHWEASSSVGPNASFESLRIPSSLQELLLQRISALSPGARELVRAAAVLGRTFMVPDVARMLATSEERLTAYLHEAQERYVLEPLLDLNSCRFAHDKLREAAYSTILASESASWHEKAAIALEANALDGGSAISGEIAGHYKLGRNHARAMAHFEKAGDASIAGAARRDAATFFSEALELAKVVGGVSKERRARWHYECGAALHDTGKLTEGNQQLEAALSLLGHRVPRNAFAFGTELSRDVARQAAHRLFPRRFLEARAAESERVLATARVLDRLQQAYYYTGEALPMLYACLRTLNLTESARPSPDLTIAYANAHAVAGVLPSRKLVRVYRQRALANIESAPDHVSQSYFLMLSGVYHTGIGAWHEAESALTTALSLSEQIKFARRQREVAGALCIVPFYAGEFAKSGERADALHALTVSKDEHAHSWALLSQAQVAFVRGEYELVAAMTKEVIAGLDKLMRPERIWSLSLQAGAALALGDRSHADETSARALEEIRVAPPVTHSTIDSYALCAQTRLELLRVPPSPSRRAKGDSVRLARDACSAVARLTRVFPIAQPRALLVRGLWHKNEGEIAKAARMFRESRSVANRLQMPYDALRARGALAALDLNPATDQLEYERADRESKALGAVLGLDLRQR